MIHRQKSHVAALLLAALLTLPSLAPTDLAWAAAERTSAADQQTADQQTADQQSKAQQSTTEQDSASRNNTSDQADNTPQADSPAQADKADNSGKTRDSARKTAPAVKPVTTTLSGVAAKITKDYDKSITDTVTISPARGRRVELYLYNEDTKEWILEKTFLTANTKKAELTIKYPGNWKAHATSRWKIFVPAADSTNSHNTKPAAKAEARATLHNKFLKCKTAAALSAEDGEFLYDLKKDKKRKIASLTKMMTALLLVEEKPLSTRIKIRKSSIKEVSPWQYGFKSGDSMTAQNALYAMMIASINEVADSAGQTVSGSRKAFVRKMNLRARELGMLTTVYKNAHGLDVGKKQYTGNYSTARDQALLAQYIMTTNGLQPIRKAMKTKSKTIKTKKGRYSLGTTNELLGKNGCIGMKTGTDDKAGCCFAGAFRYKGKTYITVVLGAKSEASRWKNTKKLYRYVKYAVEHNITAY